MKRALALFGLTTFICGTALSGPAFAAAGVAAVGNVHCINLTGTLTFGPRLADGGTERTEVMRIKLNLSTCTGTGDAQNINMGKFSGLSKAKIPAGGANDCATLTGTSTTPLNTSTTWKVKKATPKLLKSGLPFLSRTGTFDPSGHLTIDASGVVATGSFVGDGAALHVAVSESQSAIASMCAGSGVGQLSINNGSLDLTQPAGG
ncbi:MAG: hypothetical protein JWL83_126 [Actinomycetia bacterium]|nr:hypothetical protein [Actinomycetes bacterium]